MEVKLRNIQMVRMLEETVLCTRTSNSTEITILSLGF